MVKRVIAILLFLLFALTAVLYAFTLLTKDQALAEVFFRGRRSK